MEKTCSIVNQCGRTGIGDAKYMCFEDFVLRAGRPWPLGRRPSYFRMGQIRQCYMNAARRALKWPDRYIYCEGYARGIIPVLHAWLVCPEGRVLDPTWPDYGLEYFGVAIKHSYLLARLEEQETFGLIDQPEHKWPLLRDDPKQWRHPINDL